MSTFRRVHYESVALVLAQARAQAAGEPSPTHRLSAIGDVHARLTDLFMADNPAFDGERFAQAAGVRRTY